MGCSDRRNITVNPWQEILNQQRLTTDRSANRRCQVRRSEKKCIHDHEKKWFVSKDHEQ